MGLFDRFSAASAPVLPVDMDAVLSPTVAQNLGWAKRLPSYQTALAPDQERQFRSWVQQSKVPFDPTDPRSDYDMRGYWLAQRAGAAPGTAINANDGRPHYPDTYKTPYHQSFSAESQYALPTAPVWANDYQLVDPATGHVVFDEKAAAKGRGRN